MKNAIRKISSFSMALVVLFSTMSFTIDMHFCGDTLVDTAIFSKAATCGMEINRNTNPDCSIVKNNCCDEQQIHFEGQKELKTTSELISFEQQIFVISFVQSYINLFYTEQQKVTLYKNYSPPLVVKEIHKLDETYLI